MSATLPDNVPERIFMIVAVTSVIGLVVLAALIAGASYCGTHSRAIAEVAAMATAGLYGLLGGCSEYTNIQSTLLVAAIIVILIVGTIASKEHRRRITSTKLTS